MEPKKKMGRPSQGKVWKSFTADKEIADFLDSLPDGERSKFINDALARGIAEHKAMIAYTDNLRNRLDEQSNVPQVKRLKGE